LCERHQRYTEIVTLDRYFTRGGPGVKSKRRPLYLNDLGSPSLVTLRHHPPNGVEVECGYPFARADLHRHGPRAVVTSSISRGHAGHLAQLKH
jgi:hypothetical protein